MTKENDLIRRGDAMKAVTKTAIAWGVTGEPAILIATKDTIAALPVVAASLPADPVVKADSRHPEQMYLICKHGGYYRPNCQGYTSSIHEAGRYTLAEAERETHPNGPDGPRDGMSYISDPLASHVSKTQKTDHDPRDVLTQPDPRDAVIARLVETSEALRQDMMERARCGMDVIYGTEYRIVNAGRTAWDDFCDAIAAAKGGAA